MSDALENKAVEILDKSQAAIGAFADKLGEMAKQYGPDVADAALSMARVDAIDHIVRPVLFSVAFLIGGAVALPRLWAWRKTREAYWLEKGSYNSGDPTFGAVILTAAWGIATTACILLAANIWAWVGIFEPKLWLAKRILGL